MAFDRIGKARGVKVPDTEGQRDGVDMFRETTKTGAVRRGMTLSATRMCSFAEGRLIASTLCVSRINAWTLRVPHENPSHPGRRVKEMALFDSRDN